MDESKLRPGFPGDRSQAAAEKLRALRERANQALDDHRRRLGEIETQLSDRVRRLAEECGAPAQADAPTPPVTAADHQAELESLRRQVAEGRAKHERFVEQLAAARRQLEALQSQPCTACEHAAQQVLAAQEEARRLREQLAAAAQVRQEDRIRHEKFVEQLAAARQAITVLQHSAGESTTELRRELEAACAARAAAEQQLAAALQAAEDRVAAADRRAAAAEERLAATTRDMDVLHVECDALGAQVAELQQQLLEVQNAHAQLQEQASQLTAGQGDASAAAQELRTELNARADELHASRAEADQLRTELAALAADKERLEAAHAQAKAEAAEELAALVEQLAAAEADGESLRRQLQAGETERLNAALAMSQAEGAVAELQRGLAAAEQQLADVRGQLAESEARLEDSQRQLADAEQRAFAGADVPALRQQLEQAQAAAQERAQLTVHLERTLDETRRELNVLRTSMAPKADLEEAQRRVEAGQALIQQLEQTAAELRGQLAQAEAREAALHASMRPAAEVEELQAKFELALADVQLLKRENGELRDELAERPLADDRDTPELIALRSERDALAAQVAELEQAAAVAVCDVNLQQERDDLQRRFEMAVDDVRQLKQENAKLRDQLASAAPSADAASGGGSDWAAQRAKLMALLQEEDDQGEISAERVAERATVNKTIAATDRVIAHKDQEIAELRAALEARGAADAHNRCDEEILEADEIVARERKRLAELNAEWEAKLRAAELEFSVERAKLAREQAALREKMFELQAAAPADAQSGDGTKPRRRWLSALGLHDDAEGDKKN